MGEAWVYYLAGSFVEVVLLLVLVRTASTWPAALPAGVRQEAAVTIGGR